MTFDYEDIEPYADQFIAVVDKVTPAEHIIGGLILAAAKLIAWESESIEDLFEKHEAVHNLLMFEEDNASREYEDATFE